MPVTYIYTENTLAQWRTYTNIIGANVGDLDRIELSFPGNVDLVSAINSLYSLYLTVNNLANATSFDLGNITGFYTNANDNVVMAINELWGNAGPMPNLLTAANSNLVYAINELWSNVGNQHELEPLVNTNLVAAINYLWNNPVTTTTYNTNVTVNANLFARDGFRSNGNVDVYDTLNTRGNVDLAGNITTVRTSLFYVNTPEANITQNLLVGGDTILVGNLELRGELSSYDSLLKLASNNNINPADAIDIGFVGKYPETFNLWSEDFGNAYIREGYSLANGYIGLEDNSGNIVFEDYVDGANTITRYAGLFRDASQQDDRFVFFSNLAVEPTGNVVDTANLSFAFANVQADYFIGNLMGWADWARQIYATNVIENGNTTSGNVFFSNARTRLALSNTGPGINYNKIAGLFSLDIAAVATAVFATANTDLVPEGNVNYYYTNARAQVWLSEWLQFTAPLEFDAANGIVSLGALTTDNVPEGTVNLYFTNTRARAAISNVGNAIMYNELTGEISANIDQIVTGVSSWNGSTGAVSVDSDAVPEGTTNLYFTDANWAARLSTLFTNSILENPDSNLANTTIGYVYFTNARARAALSNVGTELEYDEANGILSLNTSAIVAGVSSVNNANGNVILYTSNIGEDPNPLLANTDIGNVYFTNARARHSISVIGAATYNKANGEIYVPGPYGLAYRRFKYTLAAPATVVSGPDDDGHTMYHELAAATDVYVNGVKAIANVDYTINNTFPSSNVVFNITLPLGTQVLTQEITGNLALSQGYITESRTDYLENLNNQDTPSATFDIDLALGANTVFRINVDQSTTLTFSNPPLTVNKAFVFTIFTDLGAFNNGNWTITWPANVRWDDNSAPIMSINPSVLEAYTFFTIDSGNLYYGYKNLQNAPNS